MSYPIIVVCAPGEKTNLHVNNYSGNIRVNPWAMPVSRFDGILRDYSRDRWSWLYDATGLPASFDVVKAYNDATNPNALSLHRKYRHMPIEGTNKPSLLDFAKEQYPASIVTTTRISADTMPDAVDTYILTDLTGTELIDVVVYQVKNSVFDRSDAQLAQLTNFLLNKQGTEFTAGTVDTVDWAAIDRIMLDDLLPWALKDQSSSRRHPFFNEQTYSRREMRLSYDFDGDQVLKSPDSLETIKVNIINGEYGRLRVIKPDGQLLGNGNNCDVIIGAYIREYLQSLPADTYIRVYKSAE
jgi:hypothetical protein